MINHYKDIVDEIYVVVYRQNSLDGILEDVLNLGIKPHKIVTEPKFNWERVTELYNEVKQTKPNEWWVVSDDDEFHIYPKPIREMISDCEENGWEFITGGFLDRIGERGEFPLVKGNTDIWKSFPLAGFFRYPMSGAMPNKCCVMKGSVNVTPGQHFAKIDDSDTWRERGWNHPKRYPIEKGLVQVHHFKWDSTVLERLKEVSETKKDYSFWKEYKKMYRGIQINDWKIDINNPEFMFEKMEDNSYFDYTKWKELSDVIVKI
tara:strand:+ start:5 stop:790 length:786 start_codon:yes stop_codon:yes gene_type:complete